ncbi:MAG: hypothetical protein A2664_00120 [Candidatus Taylorbacteria bacterium RIFCSPHIGHO2_01_FULL_46_22b]|uniref:Carbohydrate kinase PfkB domain-containing protein n=1 Tax=Candidatus Taylorbacteria bacterium RIFCSPHIGHO2_01_FULL_46_22b TaxID=1802301 RepID=A0A1G2M1T3_9BACT|nr:MAG: hypothetical protein A2664_00120 [Candidatus Taylorbacteria bacterium RIFCSPHIGHO2_01_FULL_46_22b]
MQKVDFLAIGDITIDSFIRIKDASVSCSIDRELCQLCVKFGEKIPYESLDDIPAVGNAPNASVAVSRLGISSALVTDIGDDNGGKECVEQLKKERVNIDFVHTHATKHTNHHFVLWYDDERTILVRHAKYQYQLPVLPECSWMYLSSIGADSETYHEQIETHLKANPDIKLVFQPGTFQIQMGAERLAYFYQRAEFVAVNVGEAIRIIGKELPVLKLLDAIHKLGPKLVLITDGRKGAYLFDGTDKWFLPIYPDPRPPLERTGAGDAATATLAAYLFLGETPIEAFRRSVINSRNVVQEVGAQRGLMTREDIEETLRKAPPEFAVQKIS